MPSFAEATAANARAVASLSDADLRALMPVLGEAREITARKLHAWLSKRDREEKYTTAAHQQLIASLDRSRADITTRLYHGVALDLHGEGRDAGSAAVRAMVRAANAGSARFRDSAAPLRLDVAAIVNDNSRNLLGRHAGSALRYAGRQGDDIRTTLAAGLASGESTGSLVARLMRKPRFLADRMTDVRAADAIAEASFFRSKSDAERLVRTENIHAANAAQVEALRQDNDGDPDGRDGGDGDGSDDSGDGEGGWQKRWDATFDSRTCEDCEDLDGEIVDVDDDFSSGDPHPPLHPYCRCTITPWREGWEL